MYEQIELVGQVTDVKEQVLNRDQIRSKVKYKIKKIKVQEIEILA